MDAEEFLLSKYPGNNPIVIRHIKNAAEQLKYGQTIGVRATPVVSFWMMKDKWKNRGSSWETFGTDGDPGFDENHVLVQPQTIRLVYFVSRCGLVCQLAYLLNNKKWPATKEVITYEEARLARNTIIDDQVNTLEPMDKNRVNPQVEVMNATATAEAANDIIASMSKIYG